uniref:Apple domain-containing protein n=1 Tax=Globisporangium ultimum (strain ATCC 200006 / CBS 805.95 / DAOM BR144) TaxID=431595 RepID=K3X667_GLOUD
MDARSREITQRGTTGAICEYEAAYAIPGYSCGFAPKVYESVCGGGDQSAPAKCFQSGSALFNSLPLAYEKNLSVTRLLVNDTNLCTGWLAGSDGHLITNPHCTPTADYAMVTDYEFDAESTACSGSHWAYKYLQLRGTGPAAGESIYVLQHPFGYAKRTVSVIEDNSGPSESPLLAASDNIVVAVHHCGFASVCANSAVDVRDIIGDLRTKKITVSDLVASSTPATPAPTATVPAPTAPAPTTPAPTTVVPIPTTVASTPAPMQTSTPTPAPAQTPAPPPTPTSTTKAPALAPTYAPSGGTCGNSDDGMTYCAPGDAQFGIYFTGINTVDDNLVTVYDLSSAECCALCADTAGCAYYTFPHLSGVLLSKPACSTPQFGSCGSSQGTTCCPPDFYCQPWSSSYYQCLRRPAACANQLTGIDFDGNDLGALIYGLQPSECCTKCSKTTGCKGYTFINKDMACYLKSSLSGKRTSPGAVSGILNAPVY